MEIFLGCFPHKNLPLEIKFEEKDAFFASASRASWADYVHDTGKYVQSREIFFLNKRTHNLSLQDNLC